LQPGDVVFPRASGWRRPERAPPFAYTGAARKNDLHVLGQKKFHWLFWNAFAKPLRPVGRKPSR